MLSRQVRKRRALERLEGAIVDLINTAERFACTEQSLWDMRNRRAELLGSARTYSRALRAVAK